LWTPPPISVERLGATRPLARVDTGVRQGDRVSPFYDALVAKIIVWGESRASAVARLRRALAETAILGVSTNLGFLSRLAAQPDFAAAEIDTGFIERHATALRRSPRPTPDLAVAAAALVRLMARQSAAAEMAARSADRYSPWARTDGWSPCGAIHQTLVFRDGEAERVVTAYARATGWRLRLGDREAAAGGEWQAEDVLAVDLDGVRRPVTVLRQGCEIIIFADGESWRLSEIDPLAVRAGEDAAAGRLTAPMPGRVIRLLVEPGRKVRRGEPLLIIEAMKMEHTVAAPADGIVTKLGCALGDLIEEGAELIALAPAENDRPAEARC
jgi:3-methylcrotonyl-CoA carboxylase alpha subunit